MKWKSQTYLPSTLLVTAMTLLVINLKDVNASCKVSTYSSDQCICQLDSCLNKIVKASYTIPPDMLDNNAQSGTGASGSDSSTDSGATGGTSSSTGGASSNSTGGASSNSTESSPTDGATANPNATTGNSENGSLGGSSSGSDSGWNAWTSVPAGSSGNSTEGSTGGSTNLTTESSQAGSTEGSLDDSTEGNTTTEGYTTVPPVGRRKRSVTDTADTGNSTDSPENGSTVGSTDGSTDGSGFTIGSGNVTEAGDPGNGQMANNDTSNSSGDGAVTTETSNNITVESAGGADGTSSGSENSTSTSSNVTTGTSSNAPQTKTSTTTSLPAYFKRPPPTSFNGIQFDAQKQATACVCKVGSRVRYDIRFTEEPWNLKLADPNSTEFVTLSKDVERKLDDMYMASNLSSLYVRSWVISFKMGSVIAETETQLNQQKNDASKVVKFSFVNGTEDGTLDGKSVDTPNAFTFNGSSLLGNDSASVEEKGPKIKPVPKDEEISYFVIITLPSIAGIFTFFCICLCCTRGDSCICKICAEKKPKNEYPE